MDNMFVFDDKILIIASASYWMDNNIGQWILDNNLECEIAGMVVAFKTEKDLTYFLTAWG